MTRSASSLLLALCILSIGVWYGATLRPGHDWGDDFAMYIHHAKNITEGRPYRETGFIRDPYDAILSPTAYPPVFPLMLSPVVHFWGLNLEVMKGEIVLCLMVLLLAVAKMAQDDGFPTFLTATLLLAIGGHPFLWVFKDNVTSDIPFTMFFFLSGWLIKSESTRWYALLMVLCACGTRLIGGAILASFLYDQFWENRSRVKKTPIVLLSLFLCLFCWFISKEARTYFVTFSTFQWKTIPENLFQYALGFSSLWHRIPPTFLESVGFVFLAGMACFGLCQKWRRGPIFMEMSLGLYFIVLLGYPYRELRFLIPLIPAFLYYVLYGIAPFFHRRIGKIFLAGVIGSVLLSYSRIYHVIHFGPIQDSVTSPEASALFGYIRQNTQDQDIFLFEKPRALSLYTGRRASGYHAASYADMWSYMKSIQATYVITCARHNASFDQFIRGTPRCRSVYRNSEFEIWKVLP